jgi:hypothetical protein
LATNKTESKVLPRERKWESINVSKDDLKACEAAMKLITEGNPTAAALMGRLSKTEMVSFFLNEGIKSVNTKPKSRK